MPKNILYMPEVFAGAIATEAADLKILTEKLTRLAKSLHDPAEPLFDYNTDHADEILHNLSEELQMLAVRLETYREYSKYPSTPDERDSRK